MKADNARMITYSAVAGAMAYILARFTKIAIFAAAPFLKLDFGEIPLLIFSLIGGAPYGLLALALKELLSFFVSGSNVLGLLADYICCGAFLVAFYAVVARVGEGAYKKGIVLGTLLGGVVRMAIAIPVNLLFLRLQFGTPAAGVWVQMPYILPFNMIKCVLGGVCALYLYKRVVTNLRKMWNVGKSCEVHIK